MKFVEGKRYLIVANSYYGGHIIEVKLLEISPSRKRAKLEPLGWVEICEYDILEELEP